MSLNHCLVKDDQFLLFFGHLQFFYLYCFVDFFYANVNAVSWRRIYVFLICDCSTYVVIVIFKMAIPYLGKMIQMNLIFLCMNVIYCCYNITVHSRNKRDFINVIYKNYKRAL